MFPFNYFKQVRDSFRESFDGKRQEGFRNQRNPVEILAEWGAMMRIHDPINYTQFHHHDNISDPKAGLPWKFLVTMARLYLDKDGVRRNVLLENLEDKMVAWDIISTTLVSNIRRNSVIGEIGHILDVPPQNILSTNETDVWIKNHIGRKDHSPKGDLINPYALADHIMERTKPPKARNGYLYLNRGVPMPGPKRIKTFEYLTTPSEVEMLTSKRVKSLPSFLEYQYNEVIVIGRPNINIYLGMPLTQKIKVKGIYLVKKLLPKKDQKTWQEYVDLAYEMSSVNHNVPVLFINK